MNISLDFDTPDSLSDQALTKMDLILVMADKYRSLLEHKEKLGSYILDIRDNQAGYKELCENLEEDMIKPLQNAHRINGEIAFVRGRKKKLREEIKNHGIFMKIFGRYSDKKLMKDINDRLAKYYEIKRQNDEVMNKIMQKYSEDIELYNRLLDPKKAESDELSRSYQTRVYMYSKALNNSEEVKFPRPNDLNSLIKTEAIRMSNDIAVEGHNLKIHDDFIKEFISCNPNILQYMRGYEIGYDDLLNDKQHLSFLIEELTNARNSIGNVKKSIDFQKAKGHTMAA